MSSTDTTACSNNNIMPLCIAAFANCTERISCCVNTISSYRTNCLSPLTSVVRQSANGLALFICIASSPESRQPSDVITWWRRRAARRSTNPEPQIPIGFWSFCSRADTKVSSILPAPRNSFTALITPALALLPCEIPLPSNAGPAAVEHAYSVPLLFNRISAFVPRSTANWILSASHIRKFPSIAAASAPTCAAMPGNTVMANVFQSFQPTSFPNNV